MTLGEVSKSLSLVAVTSHGEPEAEVLRLLRAVDQPITVVPSIDDLIIGQRPVDALILLDADVSTAASSEIHARLEELQTPPCVVFVGDELKSHPLAHQPRIWREFFPEHPGPGEIEALLERLTWKQHTEIALHEELDDLQLQLDAMHNEFVSFTGQLSHEVQAELKHIGKFAQQLQESTESKLDAAGAWHLGCIKDAATRGYTIVRDSVALAQLKLMKATLSSVDLEQLVRECIAEITKCKDAAEWKVAALPHVVGDRALLRLAIKHLLSNANKFTRAAERPRIEVISIQNRAGTTIQVLDNGVGFDESRAHRLFAPFERLHASRDFEGNGVGLAMVKAVAERHGGRVAGHGRPGGGAAFSLWLPHGSDEGLSDASRLGAHSRATAGSCGQPILLVDDDELVLATLLDMLQRQGHDVITASSADEGLALLQESPTRFHAVISDWCMPGRDGTAIAASAKLANCGTATILLTGRPPPRGEAAHKAPPFVDEILIKPVSHEDLLRVLSPGPGPSAGCS